MVKNAQFEKTDSGIVFYYYGQAACKNYSIKKLFIYNEDFLSVLPKPAKVVGLKKTKLITIHGNITYDFFSRSKIDTPFKQQNFQQHTERIYLDILIKEKYPIRGYIVSRQSNSPFFKDFFDVNFNFDRYTYNKNLKQALLNQVNTQWPQLPNISLTEKKLIDQMKSYQALRVWLEEPSLTQKIIEEREKAYYKIPNKKIIDQNETIVFPDSLKGKLKSFSYAQKKHLPSEGKKVNVQPDSTGIGLIAFYQKEKIRLDSLLQNINKLQKNVDSLKRNEEKDKQLARQRIYKAGSEQELKKIAGDYGLSREKDNKLQNILSSVKSFSVGRSTLNYTELTAQNIIMTGINVEYNPSYYAAFATYPSGEVHLACQ